MMSFLNVFPFDQIETILKHFNIHPQKEIIFSTLEKIPPDYLPGALKLALAVKDDQQASVCQSCLALVDNNSDVTRSIYEIATLIPPEKLKDVLEDAIKVNKRLPPEKTLLIMPILNILKDIPEAEKRKQLVDAFAKIPEDKLEGFITRTLPLVEEIDGIDQKIALIDALADINQIEIAAHHPLTLHQMSLSLRLIPSNRRLESVAPLHLFLHELSQSEGSTFLLALSRLTPNERPNALTFLSPKLQNCPKNGYARTILLNLWESISGQGAEFKELTINNLNERLNQTDLDSQKQWALESFLLNPLNRFAFFAPPEANQLNLQYLLGALDQSTPERPQSDYNFACTVLEKVLGPNFQDRNDHSLESRVYQKAVRLRDASDGGNKNNPYTFYNQLLTNKTFGSFNYDTFELKVSMNNQQVQIYGKTEGFRKRANNLVQNNAIQLVIALNQVINIPKILNDIFNDHAFLAKLCGKDVIAEEAEQTQYLMSRVYKHLGIPHQIMFNPKFDLVENALLELSDKQILQAVWEYMPIKRMTSHVQHKIRVELQAQKLSGAMLQNYLKPLVPADQKEGWKGRYFILDNNVITGVTKMGALALLQRIGCIESFNLSPQ